MMTGRGRLTEEDQVQLAVIGNSGAGENPRILISVSGGKDSTALALWAMEAGLKCELVHMETGWEAAGHEEYMAYLETILGPITRLRSERGGMLDWALHQKRWPSRVSRWCTRVLKIYPMLEHIDAGGVPVVNSVGVRAGESLARAMLPRWDDWTGGSKARKPKVPARVWRPLLDWTLYDVGGIHRRHNVKPNPLYVRGAKRVGCWPCIFSSKADLRFIHRIDPGRIDEIERYEAEVGAPFLHSKSKGKTPMPIREVVAWARTVHGGKQLGFHFEEDEAPACVTWGLCE